MTGVPARELLFKRGKNDATLEKGVKLCYSVGKIEIFKTDSPLGEFCTKANNKGIAALDALGSKCNIIHHPVGEALQRILQQKWLTKSLLAR